MYAFSSKSGSEPFRALGDLTWNDPIGQILAAFTLTRTSFKKSLVLRHQKRSNSINNRARIKMKAFLERIFHKLSHAHIKLMI